MKKYTYREIKETTKERVNDRFGDVFLITLIPGLIIYIISLITGLLTSFIPFPVVESILDISLTRILNIMALFATTYMMVKFTRGRNGFTLSGIFDSSRKIIQYFIYSIIVGLFYVLAFLPMFDMIYSIIPAISSTTNPEAISAIIVESIETYPDFVKLFYMTLTFIFIVSLIMIKFRFTKYLIIDKDINVLEAMKESWILTNRNYFRILFFPFTFFWWFMLGIITCGIGFIYFGPLLETGRVYLYLHISREKKYDSEDFPDRIPSPTIEEEDPLNIDY